MIHRYSELVGVQPVSIRDPLSPLPGREPLPPISNQSVPPHAFLPDSAVVPDPFEPVQGTYGRTQLVRLANGRCEVTRTRARRSYTLCGTPEADDTVLSAEVNVLAPGDRSSESREALHKDTLWQEFDGEPTFEDTTNWVIGRIDRDIVDGFDRTAVLERSPILSCSPLPDDAPANPFREFVIVVQSTPWGTLEIGAHLVPVRSKGHAIELVESLTDECLDRILESPDPIADGPGYSEIGAAGATGPVPTTVEWSAMTDVERDRILLAALEHFDDGSGVGLEKLLELLEQRYRTPRAEAREYIDALVDRDEVVEPPEVRVALAPSGCDNNTM